MLTSALDMSPAVELAHRRLCDYYWANAHFPSVQTPAVREIFRCESNQVQQVLDGLKAAGWRRVKGRITHPFPSSLLAEARQAHTQAVERGRVGARIKRQSCSSRAAQPELLQEPCSSTPAQAKLKHNDNDNSHSHSNMNRTLNAERSALSAQERAEIPDGTAAFLDEITTLFPPGSARARNELANWGGWWTNRYRENPDKARRVLAEVRGMVKERRIKASPGAAATDLWKRLP